LSDAKLLERFPESENDDRSGKPAVRDFNEPHEWLAMLSSSDQHQNHQTTSNQQTPLMTPKKVASRPNTTTRESQNPSKLSSPQNEERIQIAMGDGQQSDNFQLADDLVEDNIVASVTVDVDKDGPIQLTDGDGNELGAMMVSLSVELDSEDTILPSSDFRRPEPVAVVTSPSKASAAGSKCKTSSAVHHKNCTIPKHAHGRSHSTKTGKL